MLDQQEITQRLVIIKHSGLDDVKILDRNYTMMLRDAPTVEEQKQFEVLRLNIRRRIRELTGENEQS